MPERGSVEIAQLGDRELGGCERKPEVRVRQLCAQALCLEEMFQTEVPRGYIYHAASKRRREVIFDERLREETMQTIKAVRTLLTNREVPAAILKPRCDGCSLREVCMPELTRIHNAMLTKYERDLWR